MAEAVSVETGFASELPYTRGSILTSTEDEYAKLRHAWRIVHERIEAAGPDGVFNFTGLDRRLQSEPVDPQLTDDDLAPAEYLDRLTDLALQHLGGTPARHDVAVFNRVTASIFASTLVLVRPTETVIGVSAGYSHPVIRRSLSHVGARFVDTTGPEEFSAALEGEERVSLVVLTRLAVTDDLLEDHALAAIVDQAHSIGARVLADDAGGARVGPAVFGQPRTLEMGVDVGSTGLDKYGTKGPRLGLLAGERDLVAQIRARGFELGLEARPMLYPAVVASLEAYQPDHVRAQVATTKLIEEAMRLIFGDRVHATPVTAQLLAQDIFEIARERSGEVDAEIVPYEATAALAMILLQDYGILTVHFAGLPPGTSALLVKFIAPETLNRFGGASAFAEAVDDSLNRLADMVGDPNGIRSLLLGDPSW